MPTAPVSRQDGLLMAVHQERDDISNAIALSGSYEREMTRILRDELRPGDVMVDVGAHIGYHTLTAACAVGPTGRVHAFEPVPANRNLLLRNLELNDLRQVEVHGEAAWDGSAETLEMHLQEGKTGCHSVAARSGPSLTVLATSLDAALGDRPVRLMKIDVEGAEARVIDGARRVVTASPHIVVILEMFQPLMNATGTSPQALIAELSRYGLRPELVVGSEASRRFESEDSLPTFANVLFRRPG